MSGHGDTKPPSSHGDPGDGLNQRQRTFAELVLDGFPATRAYVLAGYEPNSANGNANRLLRDPAVAAYIAAGRGRLRADAAAIKDQLTDYLQRVIATSPGEVDADSDIAQELVIVENSSGTRTRVKMISKVDAMKMLATLHGLNRPAARGATALEASPYAGIFGLIRANPLPGTPGGPPVEPAAP